MRHSLPDKIAVGIDAAAVTALITPESQLLACHRFQTSMARVEPQPMMNTPK
jgi:hypothetical protein